MELQIEKYEDIYRKLKKCFNTSFGNQEKAGLISMNEVKKQVYMRRKEDMANDLPRNSLIEIPEKLYESLKETYTSRDSTYISGTIGCTETVEEQLDGITNMALLMYLSNHLSKQYKFMNKANSTKEQIDKYKQNEKILLTWKHIALSDIMASIYVLQSTSTEYSNYYSYGNRVDDEGKDTFAIDLPYIGQLCVHFGWEENKNIIIKRAKDTAKSILEKKVELGQITQNQLSEILLKLDKEGILPEYEGKLYEYVGAIPIEYIGEKTKEYRKIIGNKLPEEMTNKDIEKMRKQGLNEREMYYFFIKMGAPKSILNKISKDQKKITKQSIDKAINDITIDEFNEATRNLKELVQNKENEKVDSNIRI